MASFDRPTPIEPIPAQLPHDTPTTHTSGEIFFRLAWRNVKLPAQMNTEAARKSLEKSIKKLWRGIFRVCDLINSARDNRSYAEMRLA